MNKKLYFALMVAIAATGTAVLTACSDDLSNEKANIVYDENGQAGVKPEFVISIPRTVVGATRMTNEVTQNEGTVAQFRGLDNIRLIPFSGAPTGTTAKFSDIMSLSPIGGTSLSAPGTLNYKVYANEFVPMGTKHFLFYAKAIDAAAETAISTMDEKFHYGVLNAANLTNGTFTKPNDITFSLEQINKSTAQQAGDPTGQRIVALLTDLANTTVTGATAPHDKWSTTTNMTLAYLYKHFIAIRTSSSNNVALMLSQFYNALTHVQSTDPSRPLANALKAKIENVCASAPVSGSPLDLKADYAGYPGNIGLPDGAASVRWTNANSFQDVTANYGKGNRIGITQYVYPAALWYYVSTPLKAADAIMSGEYETAGNWAGVINGVYKDADEEVVASTQSVALQLPVEYSVGRIETKIKMGDGVFYDGNGKEVNTGNGFTLKGMLIGGQNTVGYDFTPKLDENLTIYDREMSGNIIAKPNYTTAIGNQTLALETKSNQAVYAALELVNGGDDFVGADGIIRKGATFYLTVQLDPATASNYQAGTLDKIVMKDHVTKVTVTIKNGATFPDRDGDGTPDTYIKDPEGNPTGVDTDGDGNPDPYDIDGDGNDDTFITDPDHGGPGWDTDGDGEVDVPVVPDTDGKYPDEPTIPEGLGNATNGVPDLSSPGVELGTSVNLEWQEGLNLTPSI